MDTVEIDAASNTGVDDIRELREKVKLAPTSSKYKVYIIDEVHMLSNSAFNALLKTLEEPPAHVIFVLATTDSHKLPATIVSRCLVYDFGKANKEEIISSLKKKAKKEDIKIDEATLEEISFKADGSFRDADKLLEQFTKGEELFDGQKLKKTGQEIVSKLAVKDGQSAIGEVEKYIGGGGRIKDLMTEIILELKVKILENPQYTVLITKLIEANGLIKDSPLPELPLELVIAEWCGQSETPKSKPMTVSVSPVEPVSVPVTPVESKAEIVKPISAAMPGAITDEKWQEIITAVKPYNHNLSALLRSSRPVSLKGDYLTIEAFYKFHKDKLSEDKNIKILEEVISGILGANIKIKFTLKEV